MKDTEVERGVTRNFLVSGIAVLMIAGCGGSDDAVPDKPTATACFDQALYAPAAIAEVEYAYTDSNGASIGSGTFSSVVQRTEASFVGVDGLVERLVRFREQELSASGLPSSTLAGSQTLYERPEANGDVTRYGEVADSPFVGAINHRSITYTPPMVDSRANMKVGEERIFRWQGNVSGGEGSQSTTFDESKKVVFVGMETVRVPSGTYMACRFDGGPPGGWPYNATEWIAHGLVVKRWYPLIGKGVEATRITRNGQPLK